MTDYNSENYFQHENQHHHQTEEQNNHHFENHHQQEQQQQNENSGNSSSDFSASSAPSAPPTHDDNGYIVVPPTPQTSIDTTSSPLNSNEASSSSSHDNHQPIGKDGSAVQRDDINSILEEISRSADSKLNQHLQTVLAEADSSTGNSQQQQQQQQPQQQPQQQQTEVRHQKGSEKEASEAKCSYCPYYLFACDRLSRVHVPEKVRDILLWRDLKVTGALFGSLLVLLISLASFSLFTVIGSLLLVASTGLGIYRFYLVLLFRIKGTYDDTFDKLSNLDLSLPKDKIQKLVQLLESDLNRSLNKLKSVLLWDNICNSAIGYFGFYLVYCLGSWFNTLTLLILAHVSVFTLPKVYQVYKVQIDQTIEKLTSLAHQTTKNLIKKLPPFLQGKLKTN